jgi:hypothetical protein
VALPLPRTSGSSSTSSLASGEVLRVFTRGHPFKAHAESLMHIRRLAAGVALVAVGLLAGMTGCGGATHPSGVAASRERASVSTAATVPPKADSGERQRPRTSPATGKGTAHARSERTRRRRVAPDEYPVKPVRRPSVRTFECFRDAKHAERCRQDKPKLSGAPNSVQCFGKARPGKHCLSNAAPQQQIQPQAPTTTQQPTPSFSCFTKPDDPECAGGGT